MRMLPATANAMMRNAFNALVTSAAPTTNTAVSFAVLFYTGEMPTKAQLDAQFNDPQQLASGAAAYQRLDNLLVARQADYVGGVAGLKPVMTLAASNVPVLAATAMNNKLVAANNDTRNCYFLKDATPTWCIVTANYTGNLNLTTGLGPNTSGILTVVASVGDENSNADLKIKGGKVFGNSSTPTDQSKAVIISDLVLKYA